MSKNCIQLLEEKINKYGDIEIELNKSLSRAEGDERSEKYIRNTLSVNKELIKALKEIVTEMRQYKSNQTK